MSVHESEPIRRSIEVEYWVIDDAGRLVEPGTLVDATPGAEREFVEPLLEVKTTPCETATELREELLGRLGAVLRQADDLGKRLVPLSTPVNADEIQEIPSDRTRIQNCVIGDDFEFVRHCAGTHIHVEQQPGRAIDQLNTLIAIDPALALVSSSPYFRGRRLADGARSKLYRWMAYNSVPHQGWLWSYVTDRAEWDRRLERRYDEFVTAAIDAGLNRQTAVANFDPESAIWTPVQLRAEFGTVEWRSPDTALPSEVLSLAEDITGLMEHLKGTPVRIDGQRGRVTDDEIVLPEFDSVLEYATDAICDGVTADGVEPYLDRMGFEVDAYDPVSATFDRPEPVTPEAAREIRLDHATRLKADLRQVDPVAMD
ncbi:glutamate-cysteine ligase family protein [Haloarcula japonica]|uniref:Glutamate--cysteine ligase n=1 Tax=Haloarcula japonica (strain ATCC 49778 / DSM 6131 / JCM 7785 / NBRC 101032 / NCIMB 13157 / TR-1) TaxID=1227453 RepID=M0L6W0_HALJT|nr:glutamate-cysteine ligase family protein [Haloarcula japonica]EMA29281.1 glutamate--cysteine ligase [Haloarcula japonica DSM 6131]